MPPGANCRPFSPGSASTCSMSQTAGSAQRDRDHHGPRRRQHHRGRPGRERPGRCIRRRAPTVQAGDVLVSQFEIPIAAIAAFFSARPRRRRAHHSQSGAGLGIRSRPADLARYPGVERDRACLLHRRRCRRGRSARPIDRARAAACSRKDQIVCVTLGRRGAVALVDGDAMVIPGRAVDCRRHDRGRRLFRRCAGGAARRRRGHPHGAGLRQPRGVDLRAADGSRPIDADAGRGERAVAGDKVRPVTWRARGAVMLGCAATQEKQVQGG